MISTKPQNEVISRFFQQIEDREIIAGTRFSQAELSKRLNASLTPLREALKTLEYLGFIIIHPQSGIEICTPDLEMTKNCFQVRRMVECYNVRLYVKYGNVRQAKALLDDHFSLREQLITNNNIEDIQSQLKSLDFHLHDTIMEAAKNPFIAQIQYENAMRIMLIRLNVNHLSKNILLSAIDEHIVLLEAILSGDPDKAEAAMDRHLIEAMHRAMRA